TAITITAVDDPVAVRGTAFDFQPEGLVFAKRVTLTINHDPAFSDVNIANLTPNGLVFAVDQSVTPSSVSADLAHFSRWGLVGFTDTVPRIGATWRDDTHVRVIANEPVERAHVGAGCRTSSGGQCFGCSRDYFDPILRPADVAVSCLFAGAVP